MAFLYFHVVCGYKLNLLCRKKYTNGMGLCSNVFVCTFYFVNDSNAQFPSKLDLVGNGWPWHFLIEQHGRDVVLLFT